MSPKRLTLPDIPPGWPGIIVIMLAGLFRWAKWIDAGSFDLLFAAGIAMLGAGQVHKQRETTRQLDQNTALTAKATEAAGKATEAADKATEAAVGAMEAAVETQRVMNGGRTTLAELERAPEGGHAREPGDAQEGGP